MERRSSRRGAPSLLVAIIASSALAAHAAPTASGVTVSPPCPRPGASVVLTATISDAHGVKRAWVELGAQRIPAPRVGGTRARGVYRATLPAGPAGELTRFTLGALGAAAMEPVGGAYLSTEPPSPGAPVVWLFGLAPGPARPSKPAFSETMGRPSVVGTLAWFDADRSQACVLRHDARLSYRVGGYKVHLPKDAPLDGMTTFNLLLEQPERFMLAEALSYEMHRAAGGRAPRTAVVRLRVGQAVGPYLMVEQPNGRFLRRVGLGRPDRLYKRSRSDGPVAKAFERKRGDADLAELEALLAALADPDLQARGWAIARAFDLEQTLAFFTARALIASWDGYARNYYLHRDAQSVWRVLPWDEDQTWGCPPDTDCRGELTADLGFDGAASTPRLVAQHAREPVLRSLLEQPQFRALLMERVRAAQRHVFTRARLEPVLRAYQRTLTGELALRARSEGAEVAAAQAALDRDVEALLTFIDQRRAYLAAALAP